MTAIVEHFLAKHLGGRCQEDSTDIKKSIDIILESGKFLDSNQLQTSKQTSNK